MESETVRKAPFAFGRDTQRYEWDTVKSQQFILKADPAVLKHTKSSSNSSHKTRPGYREEDRKGVRGERIRDNENDERGATRSAFRNKDREQRGDRFIEELKRDEDRKSAFRNKDVWRERYLNDKERDRLGEDEERDTRSAFRNRDSRQEGYVDDRNNEDINGDNSRSLFRKQEVQEVVDNGIRKSDSHYDIRTSDLCHGPRNSESHNNTHRTMDMNHASLSSRITTTGAMPLRSADVRARRHQTTIIVPSHTSVECSLCGLYCDSDSCDEGDDDVDGGRNCTGDKGNGPVPLRREKAFYVHPNRTNSTATNFYRPQTSFSKLDALTLSKLDTASLRTSKDHGNKGSSVLHQRITASMDNITKYHTSPPNAKSNAQLNKTHSQYSSGNVDGSGIGSSSLQSKSALGFFPRISSSTSRVERPRTKILLAEQRYENATVLPKPQIPALPKHRNAMVVPQDPQMPMVQRTLEDRRKKQAPVKIPLYKIGYVTVKSGTKYYCKDLT